VVFLQGQTAKDLHARDRTVMTKEWWIEAALNRTKSVITSILVICGLVWLIGEPAVKAYIKKAIAEQGYATKDSVLNLNSKVLRSGNTIEAVKEEQIKQKQQLQNIDENTDEIRQLFFQFLQQQRSQPPR